MSKKLLEKNICIFFFLIFASTARFFGRCLFLIGSLVRTHKVMLIILVGKNFNAMSALILHLNYDMTDLVGQAMIIFDTVKSRW